MPLTVSCQQATLLIEQRADRRLPLPTAAGLAVHLWLCPFCKRYAVQSRQLGELAQVGAQRTQQSTRTLPATARLRIQRHLDAARGVAGASTSE